MPARYAAHTDTIQAEIVAALRAAGASVTVISPFGHGVPDLLVGITDRETGQAINLLLEVKSAHGVLTPDERHWHASWQGQVAIVRSVEDALRAIGRL